MAMTPGELAYAGRDYFYWQTQAMIDGNHPRSFHCQRAVINIGTGDVTLHGRARDAEPMADKVIGDPMDEGYLPMGFQPVPLALVPTLGACTALPSL